MRLRNILTILILFFVDIQNLLVVLSLGVALVYLFNKYNSKNDNKNCSDKDCGCQ